MATTYFVRTKGTIPSKYVPRKKSKPSTSGLGIHRAGNYGIIHGEPEHKIDDFVLYGEPDEDDENGRESEDDDDSNDGGGYIALGGYPRHSSHSSYPERRKKTFNQVWFY